MRKPYYSIGVVTYKRPVLLAECLKSIQHQKFTDFEVIIGNDDTSTDMVLKDLGIQDDRFKLYNNSKNLGEMANLNFVLSKASGKYFTWLGDDDMFTDNILEQVHGLIEKYSNPKVVYNNFQFARELEVKNPVVAQEDITYFKAQDFLKKFLERKVPLQGTYGFFETESLKKLEGIKKLGNGFSPGSDTFMAIEASTLGDVLYLKTPLVLFRAHENSLSFSSKNVEAYQTAFHDLLLKFENIMTREDLSVDRSYLAYLILKWCTQDFFDVLRRADQFSSEQLYKYLGLFTRFASLLSIRWMTFSYLELFKVITYQVKVALKVKIKNVLLTLGS